MTPDATVRVLTMRHAEIMEELEATFGEGQPVDTLRTVIDRHRSSIQLSALWLLSETSAFPQLRRRFAAQTKRVQDRLRTLRALDLRGRSMRKETRRILRAWLDTVREIVDAAAHETTNAGRDLLVRAYQRGEEARSKTYRDSLPIALED